MQRLGKEALDRTGLPQPVEPCDPTLDAMSGRIEAIYPDARAVRTARSVGSIDEPQLAAWLPHGAACAAMPALFPAIDQRCDSVWKW